MDDILNRAVQSVGEPVPKPTPSLKSARRPKRARRQRLRPVVISALLLVVVGSAGWWFFLRPQPPATPPTVAVVQGDIQDTILATGVLEASSLVSVGAQTSGVIDKLAVKVGDNVKQGDLIAQIDSLDQQNALNTAQAALAVAEAQLQGQEATVAQAQANLDRYNAMSKEAIVSDADHDTAVATLATAKAQIGVIAAQIQQANNNVAMAQLNLTRTKIVAPRDGTIVTVLVDEGQAVNAVNTSPTIVKLADMSSMQIRAQISEADVPRVHPGQAVYFTIAGDPNTHINAQLLSVYPAPDSIQTESDTATPSTTTAIYYNGLFEVPNPGGKLKIDMTAAVTVVLADAKDVLLVPSAAIHTSQAGKGSRVVVYDAAGSTQSTPVTVGINNNAMAEIKSGLAVGDLVVTNGTSSRSQSGSTASATARPPGALASRAASPLGL